MFFRIIVDGKSREMYYNIGQIEWIEKIYCTPGGQSVSALIAHADPVSYPNIRYKFRIAGEEREIQGDPNDPVTRMLAKLCEDAVKS